MIDWFRKLFEYDAWANGRVHDSLEALGSAPESVLKLAAHILVAQQAWHSRLRGEDFAGRDYFPAWSAAECRRIARGVGEDWNRYLAEIGSEDLSRIVAYRTSTGDPFESAIGDILNHVINHGTHHRGQINRAIRELGVKPPTIDFIVFTRAH